MPTTATMSAAAVPAIMGKWWAGSGYEQRRYRCQSYQAFNHVHFPVTDQFRSTNDYRRSPIPVSPLPLPWNSGRRPIRDSWSSRRAFTRYDFSFWSSLSLSSGRAISVMPGLALPSFYMPWKGPDQPLVIGLMLQIGGCGRFWSIEPVEDRQPHERTIDLPDDLWWL